MSTILPYYDSFIKSSGAFIKPNGEVLYTFGEHEAVANKICLGKDYSFLSDVKYGYSYYSDHFDEFRKDYEYSGSKEDLNLYQSTQLAQDEFLLFMTWLEEYEFSRRNIYSDFLVYLLSFDKVETIMRTAITTTSREPHIRFFNYYLMDWYIEIQPQMIYNPESGRFEYRKESYTEIGHRNDKAAEDEIQEIKAKVLKKDRPFFFK